MIQHTLARRDTTDHALSVLLRGSNGLLSVEGTGLTSETLGHDTGVLVNPHSS